MEFEMCFSNVFSLAPEINDFFRCLRLWNFSNGGKATEYSKTSTSSKSDFLCLGGKTREKADLLEVEAILAASTFIFPYKIY